MFDTFKMDVARWIDPPNIVNISEVNFLTILKLLFRHPPLRAIMWFRFGTWCHHKKIPGLTTIVQQWLYHIHGLEILVGGDIGGGLYIVHPRGTTVVPHKMGENCSIIAAVTVGMRNEWGFPTFGDNVFIGAGARVLGTIHVGDNAQIGANAVVLKDVPEGATVVGIPAKVIAIHGQKVSNSQKSVA